MPSGARSVTGAVMNDGEMTFGAITFNTVDATSVNFSIKVMDSGSNNFATVTRTMHLSDQVAFVGGDPVPVFTGNITNSNFENAILVEMAQENTNEFDGFVLAGLDEGSWNIAFNDGVNIRHCFDLGTYRIYLTASMIGNVGDDTFRNLKANLDLRYNLKEGYLEWDRGNNQDENFRNLMADLGLDWDDLINNPIEDPDDDVPWWVIGNEVVPFLCTGCIIAILALLYLLKK